MEMLRPPRAIGAVVLLTLSAVALLTTADGPAEAAGLTFEVNEPENFVVGDGDGICDDGTCTLRDAILAANANAGHDTIVFASEVFAPGSGNDNVLLSPLPNIDAGSGVTIDGTGAEVILHGFEQEPASNGLSFTSGVGTPLRDVVVRNITVDHFIDGMSVCPGLLAGQCTYQGTNIEIDGVTAAENQASGIVIQGTDFSDISLSNVIATQNALQGISVSVTNTVTGISITNATLTDNVLAGVRITSMGTISGASVSDASITQTIVGDADPNGVAVSSQEAQDLSVLRNDITGGSTGIDIFSQIQNATVAENSVSGVKFTAIEVTGRGEGIDGLSISDNTVTSARDGIDVSLASGSTDNTLIRANTVTGSAHSGIELYGPAMPGGSVIRENTISGSGRDGISIIDGQHHTFSRNRTFNNGELGIDLYPDGVTFNDVGDSDTGPNGLLNQPEWEGGADACPNCRIEIFLSDDDPSGFGEGKEFVAGIMADATGDFMAPLCGLGLAVGAKITATATDSQGNTSEFSPNYPWQGSEPCPTATPTPSPTVTPTPPATATPTPTATLVATPTTTPSVTETFTPTPTGTTAELWGDSDCSGSIGARDNQALLRHVLSQPALSQTEPCPDLGETVDGRIWGDWDCSGAIGARDNQALLRHVLSQPPLSQTEPCPDIGTAVGVS